MKYKYIFVDGTETEVDVDEETYKVLRSLDRKQRYNCAKNRTAKLRYRAVEDVDGSVYRDSYNFSEERFGEGSRANPIWQELSQKERETREETLLYFEREEIEDKKGQLQKLLTEKQAVAYFYSKYAKIKTVNIAKIMGVTEGAVRKLISKAELNLQKLNIKEVEPSDEFKLLKYIFVDNFKGYEF